jgi:selenocysteine lyase/cysteine desulfurase
VDLATFRSLFPALERSVWLDTPTVCPGARPVLDAVSGCLREWEEGTFSWRRWESEAQATRGLFAALVRVEPSSVAIVPSLAEAAATVAASLPPGRVVVGAPEFRSNLLPWVALRRRGFEVTEVPPREGVVRTEMLLQAVGEDTVLLAVSEVQSASGFRVHLAPLAERCREVGARLFVNVTQSAGVLRVDAGALGLDFVAAHGYKWLLAPRGIGWLAVRPDRLVELEPLAPNWHSVPDPYEDYYGAAPLAPDAARLTLSWAWFSGVGARAALDLLAGLDPDEVERRALSLAAAFRERARGLGALLVPEEAPSQVVSVRVTDPAGARDALRARGVVAAVRGGLLRLGFHAFNVEEDVEAAVAALAAAGP